MILAVMMIHGGRRSKSADFALLGTPKGASPASPPPYHHRLILNESRKKIKLLRSSSCGTAVLDPAALSLMLGASNRNFAVQGSARPSPKLPFPALKMCGVPHIFEGKANFAKFRMLI